MMNSMEGQIIGGFRIVERIGQGGMAVVYKAYDPSVDRHVALKTLGYQYMADEEFRVRFEREAKAIAMLEHIHILPVHAYGEENGILYLAMRYMRHGSLADKVLTHEPMPLGTVIHYASQIASALDYAHSRGVLHRDLKPENILLDADKNAYLADFGLAQLLASNQRITGNYIVGTPTYMSPEQCMGVKDLTPQADQYALGVMMYEMIVGHPPFDHDNVLALIQMHVRDVVPPPRQFRTDLPELAEQAIMRALAKTPEQRFPTCRALVDAFENGIGGKGLTRLQSASVPQEVRSRIDTALARVQLENPDDEDDYPRGGADPTQRISPLTE